MAEVRKPSDLPSAKKHKPKDSDEDDEEPQNEPGTSSTSQPVLPVLPLHQDQQPVRRDHLPVHILAMKTVRRATSIVHRVRTLEEQYSIQISIF